jgi:hypothetical protein
MQASSIRSTRSAVTAIVAALLCSGCGKSDGPPLAQVSGVVTIDSKPVKGALLEFIPQGPGGAVAYGKSDASGRYTMHFGQKRTGAVVGRSLVRITSDDRVSVDGQDYERKELFPPRYNSKSEEFVDVKEGKNTFDFPCESGDFKPAQTAAQNTGGT